MCSRVGLLGSTGWFQISRLFIYLTLVTKYKFADFNLRTQCNSQASFKTGYNVSGYNHFLTTQNRMHKLVKGLIEVKVNDIVGRAGREYGGGVLLSSEFTISVCEIVKK